MTEPGHRTLRPQPEAQTSSPHSNALALAGEWHSLLSSEWKNMPTLRSMLAPAFCECRRLHCRHPGHARAPSNHPHLTQKSDPEWVRQQGWANPSCHHGGGQAKVSWEETGLPLGGR